VRHAGARSDAHSVLKRYRHLGHATRVEPLRRGFGSEKWLVAMPAGDFVLRRFPPSFFPDRGWFVSVVQQHAAEAGLASRVIENDAADLTTIHDEHMFMLVRYVEGSCFSGAARAGRICTDLGLTLGLLHQALLSLWAAPTAPRLSLPTDPATPIRDAMSRHSASCPHTSARLILGEKLARAQRLTPGILNRHHALPQSIIHGDFHRPNVVVSQGRVVAVIDFDLACLSSPGYELVRGLLYCTKGETTDLRAFTRRACAFFEGYFAACPRTPGELAEMVGLFRTLQVVDAHGLDTCEAVSDGLLRFGEQRFRLLRWIEAHGQLVTDLAFACMEGAAALAGERVGGGYGDEVVQPPVRGGRSPASPAFHRLSRPAQA
jgi:Ser/Thr protein kinase RdoA (MazF antagonist)